MRWQFFLVLRHIFTPTTYTPPPLYLILSHFHACIHTRRRKKRCLTQRGHDVSLTCPSRLIWTFLWSFHGFTRWWACWKGILALKTKGKETNYCLPFSFAVLGRACRFLVHPFRGSSVHSNGNVRGWYLKFYRHGISYLTDWAVEIENM